MKEGEGIAAPTLIAGIVVVIMALGIGGALVQTQISNVAHTLETAETTSKEREALLLDRVKVLEEGARRAAREPVEKATIDAIVDGINKREELFQAQSTTQINDLNRQFAAALLSINANNMGFSPARKTVGPPQ
jgi:hypothetical protein